MGLTKSKYSDILFFAPNKRVRKITYFELEKFFEKNQKKC